MSENLLRKSLHEKRFTFTLELVPGRGARGEVVDKILKTAEQAVRRELVQTLSITDNPGGHPALFPNTIGREICQMGMNPLIHLTCKDKNRNQIESILYALDRLGIENLLAMSGDFPLYGFEGKAKPVFDLDSIHLLHLIQQMNAGKCIDGKAPGGGLECAPTHFFRGVAVSPFKKLESEVMAQYFKLQKKIKAGADFVITQVGYDGRKFDEVRRYLRGIHPDIPILGNVYVLTLPVARAMNRGLVPGCVVTDRLFRTIEEESKAPDRGKMSRLIRAAKLIAVLKGIGYNGVHIGGLHHRYEDVEWVIRKAEEFYGSWPDYLKGFSFPQKDGFYYFQEDPKTGLNTDVPNFKKSHPAKRPGHRMMRLFHKIAFDPQAPLYPALRWFCRRIDGSRFEWLFTELEYTIKFISSRCRRCGDCTLSEMAFLCPQAHCAKYLLNGQCGGSLEGWCEVFPKKKKCIYVRAYDRLRSYREEESLKETYIPPREWALDQTSSWANYFLGRDHRGIQPKDG